MTSNYLDFMQGSSYYYIIILVRGFNCGGWGLLRSLINQQRIKKCDTNGDRPNDYKS